MTPEKAAENLCFSGVFRGYKTATIVRDSLKLTIRKSKQDKMTTFWCLYPECKMHLVINPLNAKPTNCRQIV